MLSDSQIPQTLTFIKGFKLPVHLRSSSLAGDFAFLVRIQNRTFWLEKAKGISHLENKTSKMIMNLKALIGKYQKREWRREVLAQSI